MFDDFPVLQKTALQSRGKMIYHSRRLSSTTTVYITSREPPLLLLTQFMKMVLTSGHTSHGVFIFLLPSSQPPTKVLLEVSLTISSGLMDTPPDSASPTSTTRRKNATPRLLGNSWWRYLIYIFMGNSYPTIYISVSGSKSTTHRAKLAQSRIKQRTSWRMRGPSSLTRRTRANSVLRRP